MKIFLKYSFIASVVLVSACDYAAPQYANPGTPENLIDVSSEKVTFGLNGRNSLTNLAAMIDEDRPSSAELRCSIKNSVCAQAKEIIERNSVPVKFSGTNGSNVILVYERVVARDCSQHYIDNMSGSRSYNHPSFGCAVAGNMVQMVSDKRQFTNPSLMDLSDAEKATQSYSEYLKPSSERKVSVAEWSTGSSAK